tara:strand:+ start:160 stop:420 length:261 start_codon:yes stop_codon:yes gene_type:complete
MDIKQLTQIVQKKISSNLKVEQIVVQDKTFLHKNHKNHKNGKYHIKVIIKSQDLKKINKLENFKKIHRLIDYEIKNYIHSLQLKIN